MEGVNANVGVAVISVSPVPFILLRLNRLFLLLCELSVLLKAPAAKSPPVVAPQITSRAATPHKSLLDMRKDAFDIDFFVWEADAAAGSSIYRPSSLPFVSAMAILKCV